jgi:hypothetical protein
VKIEGQYAGLAEDNACDPAEFLLIIELIKMLPQKVRYHILLI